MLYNDCGANKWKGSNKHSVVLPRTVVGSEGWDWKERGDVEYSICQSYETCQSWL